MSNPRSPFRSPEEWMELITECRQSGLSDTAWCEMHDISVSTFYNAASRLRKKACIIPDPVNRQDPAMLDLTSHHQDVVKIDIKPEGFKPENFRTAEPSLHLDNSHTIELMMDGVAIKLSNEADPFLLQQILQMLRQKQC